MKKLILATLAVASLASCAKNELTTGTDTLEAIKLSAGVATVSAQGAPQSESRAPIEEDSSFEATIAGWEDATAATYTTAAKWSSASNITAKTAAQTIALTSPAYYNGDSDIKTFMKAWHPAETATNGVVTFLNSNGSVDVMIADQVEGSKIDKANKTLSFKHKTTQFKFKVVKGTGLETGTEIKKIEIVNAELPIGINIADNTLNYKDPANLIIPNLTQAVIDTAAEAGDPVMIKTQKGKELTLNVETTKTTYENVKATINADDNFVEGKAYTITLTFGQSSMDLSALVTAWDTGTGNGSLE